MLHYPYIDPVLLRIGPLKIHWYGLMYLFGFLAAWLLALLRAQCDAFWDKQRVSDLIFYAALGVVVGGRLGYVLFYNFAEYSAHPLSVFRLWQGGMSFHGGLLGVIVALWWFARCHGQSLLSVADFVVPLVPIGLGLGRLGNFINGELWGRVSQVPWAMVFPSGGLLPRHPSQLYEFFLEGVLLFAILWFYSRRPRFPGAVSALFLILYGLFRIVAELAREPDPQLGYIAWGWLTMGQLLSLLMVLGGLLIWFFSRYKTKERA